jgi:hypothetical protein
MRQLDEFRPVIYDRPLTSGRWSSRSSYDGPRASFHHTVVRTHRTCRSRKMRARLTTRALRLVLAPPAVTGSACLIETDACRFLVTAACSREPRRRREEPRAFPFGQRTSTSPSRRCAPRCGNFPGSARPVSGDPLRDCATQPHARHAARCRLHREGGRLAAALALGGGAAAQADGRSTALHPSPTSTGWARSSASGTGDSPAPDGARVLPRRRTSWRGDHRALIAGCRPHGETRVIGDLGRPRGAGCDPTPIEDADVLVVRSTATTTRLAGVTGDWSKRSRPRSSAAAASSSGVRAGPRRS